MTSAILDFISVHWIDLLIILAVVIALIFLAYKGKKKEVKDVVYYLVVEAEKLLGSKTGQLKLNYVYNHLPSIIKLFMSKEELINLIESGVDELKKYLKDNDADLKGVDAEVTITKI